MEVVGVARGVGIGGDVGVLRYPLDNHDPTGEHGVNLLGAVAGVYEGRPELAHFRQLEGRTIERLRPTEVWKYVRHVERFEFLEEEVEASPLPFQFVALPLDQGNLCHRELEENVEENPGEVGVGGPPSLTRLRRD